MHKAIYVAVLGTLFASTAAFADDKTGAGTGAAAPATAAPATPTPVKKAGGAGPKYGSAGCGLGSVIIGGGIGSVQVFAATTNATFGTQTFGISSGTSNCDTEAIDESARIFIYGNRETLAKDISRGKGETIANLSSLAGCRDANAVGIALQKNFRTIFPSANVSTAQVGDSVLDTLKSDKSLACANLG